MCTGGTLDLVYAEGEFLASQVVDAGLRRGGSVRTLRAFSLWGRLIQALVIQ